MDFCIIWRTLYLLNGVLSICYRVLSGNMENVAYLLNLNYESSCIYLRFSIPKRHPYITSNIFCQSISLNATPFQSSLGRNH